MASVSTFWLVLLRLYVGFFWLQHGIGKLREPEWAAPNGSMAQILQSMIKDTSGWYHDFIVNVVLPNSLLFAHLVAWGETLAGISLFLGLLTNVGGIVGVFLALNYLLAKGLPVSLDALAGLESAAIAMSLACVVLPVSKAFSLDAMIFRRRRKMRVGLGS
jgi:thiosulfate dehydrogenase [quinone] large subunit